jgi:predicted NBD/HSP70 family sugar kinase
MIVKRLYFDKAMSCAELSELFDKSIPSIAKAINELIKEGFVVEQGYAPSSGGRRPLMYAINANAMFIIAVAMDQLSARIQLVDLHNNPVAEMAAVELKLYNNENALPELITRLNDYVDKSGIPKNKIAGIGIGMPGFINATEGINYTYLDAGGISLSEYITKATSINTYIDNDSSLIALAEQKFGIARSQQEVMVINLGWGNRFGNDH